MNPDGFFNGLRLNAAPRIHACEPGWHWSPPPLPDYDLWCVLQGEGELRVLSQTFPLVPNMGFLLPPGATPRASQNSARRLHVLFAHFSLPADQYPPPPLLGVAIRDVPALSALAARLAFVGGSGQGSEAFGAARQAETLLESLLWLLHDEKNAPQESPADALVRQVASQIQATPGNDWAIDKQAKEAGLSRSQYGRRFHALFACSPADWVIEARLNRATQLLHETTMPIGEIARVLGYRDLFYFSRQFKLKKGIAPSHLRQK